MMEKTMIFAVPQSKLNNKTAKLIAGSLGKPSKMPGLSYGISATLCNVGSKLAKVVGSVCHGCYALKANYKYPSVTQAHTKRYNGLSSVSWVDSMIKLISDSKETYFRWHDSGDLQNLQHLFDIVRIAEALPSVNFWLPTKEKGLIVGYTQSFGAFPANLVVRLSSAMVDSKPMQGFAHTSTVHNKSEPIGFACKAPTQGNKCLDCRACWDKSVSNVSYHLH